jgi:hypothetical protein
LYRDTQLTNQNSALTAKTAIETFANAQARVLQLFPATVPSLQNTCFFATAHYFKTDKINLNSIPGLSHHTNLNKSLMHPQISIGT